MVNFVVGNQIHGNFSDSRYSHYERNFEICSTPQEMKMTRRMTSNFSFFFFFQTWHYKLYTKYFTDYYVRSFISMLFTTMSQYVIDWLLVIHISERRNLSFTWRKIHDVIISGIMAVISFEEYVKNTILCAISIILHLYRSDSFSWPFHWCIIFVCSLLRDIVSSSYLRKVIV